MDERLNYIEGKLKGFNYNSRKVLDLWEQLQKVVYSLYQVSSPSSKSPETAVSYQACKPPFKCNIIELMELEDDLKQQLKHHESDMNIVGDFLQTLDQNEVDLMVLRYEKGLTIKEISRIKYQSKATVFRELREILSKY